MPNPRFAFLLFLSSYSPAFLIIALRSFDHSWLLFGVSAGLCVVSVLAFTLFLLVVRQGAPLLVVVGDVEPRSPELAAYVVTYLLPFVLAPSSSFQDILGLAVFIVFIGILWVNSGMLYLNPLLAIAGYRLYVVRVQAQGGGELPRSFLITNRTELHQRDRLTVSRIVAGVYIDQGADGAD